MADRPQYYVSLGDSISIDAYAGGPGCGAASLLLRNRDDVFPDWQGHDLKTSSPTMRLIPLAQDGASSATVRYAQIPRLKEMNIRPQLVTLTMGGNDLLQTFGVEDAVRTAHRNLRENAHAILADLRKMAVSDAPLLVSTIYDPSDSTGDVAAIGAEPWPGALGWLRLFNKTLELVASEYDAALCDLRTAFHGHGMAAGDPMQTEPEPSNRALWYCGGIEPNAWGASAIRAVWWNSFTNRKQAA